jgi:hypothetical protein
MNYTVYYFIGFCIINVGISVFLSWCCYKLGYNKGYGEGIKATNILWVDGIRRELSNVTQEQEIAIELAKKELKKDKEKK